MNESNVVAGKPYNGTLSQSENLLLDGNSTCTSTQNSVSELHTIFYPSLCLGSNAIIVAKSRARPTKRDNSCLIYVDKTNSLSCGILEKIFCFDNSSIYYCLVLKLLPVSTQLCTDDITHANLASHFIACYPPR